MTALLKYDAACRAGDSLAAAAILESSPKMGAECVMRWLRTRLVSEAEYWRAHAKTGSVYFLRNARQDTIKIGHSLDIERRISTLQTGNSDPLTLVGAIAAEKSIETLIHEQFLDGRAQGEWFHDREVISAWLERITQGHPLRRHVWDFVPGQDVFHDWHEDTKTHTKHVWNSTTRQWEPPLKPWENSEE